MERKAYYRELMNAIVSARRDLDVLLQPNTENVRKDVRRKLRRAGEAAHGGDEHKAILKRFHGAFDELFALLPFARLEQGEPDAIDAILDFCELDIPAYRCGYAKEWCYTRMKRLLLSNAQTARVRQLALELCRAESARRELAELTRLLIRVADIDFLRDLKVLTRDKNPWTHRKAKRMFGIVRHHRSDLRL